MKEKTLKHFHNENTVEHIHPQYIQPYGITKNWPLSVGMWIKNRNGDFKCVTRIILKNGRIQYTLEKESK